MRKLAAFALPFAGAVLLAVYLLPGAWLLPAAAVCALGTAGCLFFRGDGRLRCALIALGLAVGFLWCWGHDLLAVAPARALAGETTRIRATVDAYPRAGNHGWVLTLRLEDNWAVKALAYVDEGCLPVAPAPGDAVELTAKLRMADTIGGEESTYYFSRGVYLIANADGDVAVFQADGMPPWYWPAAWAEKLRETVYAIYDEAEAGFFAALLTGERSGLGDGIYTALKRCGLAHVVAVSGMHLAFLVGLVRTLGGRKNRRRVALLAIPAVLVFMAMTGFPPSVVRAGVMQLMLLAAPLLGREEDPPTAMAAALLLLGVNPYAAADVGLQLSFTSVAGILLFATPMSERLTALLRLERRKGEGLPGRWGKAVGRFLAGTVCTTLGAMAFSTPLLALYFEQVSLISPLANLLCLWAVSFAFVLGFVSAVAGWLWLPLGQLVAAVAGLPVRYLFWVAPALSRFPYAAVSVENLYLWLWLGFVYLLLALWLLVKQRRKHPLIPVAACAVTLAAALALTALTFTAGDLTVTVLDVGQGLCVALHSAGHTVLVDCGGSGADDPGDVAADYVQSMGSSQVDLLVLTHYHTDHANGVAKLLERLEVGMVALPDVEEDDPLRRRIIALAEERGAEVFLLEDDAQVTFGEASMHIYAPLGAGDTNEEGLSVLATCGDYDVLITGDMGTTVERRLVKYGNLPDIEVLVVGHHGSRYATGEELLLAATPEYAAISVGYNSYGHPAAETLERLAAAGCEIYRTDWMGHVTFTVEKGAP